MKVKKLSIQNIGPIAEVEIEFNKPLLLFYGEIRQGKTTLLNCVRWALGGAFPSDILTHGATEGFIQLDFDNGTLRREFYTGKDGTVKSRELQLTLNGARVNNPVAELKKFINPFLLNQDHLRDMTAPERRRYFLDILGADTPEIDAKLAAAEQAASNLRAKLTGYGEIDLTPQLKANTDAVQAEIKLRVDHAENTKDTLRRQIKELKAAIESARDTITKAAAAATFRKVERVRAVSDMGRNAKLIEEHQSKINALELDNKRIASWLQENPELETPPALPASGHETLEKLEAQLLDVKADTADLEKKLQDAAAQNVRYAQYEKELARAEAKKADEEALKHTIAAINTYRRERIAYLLSLNDKVPGLAFDEQGNLTYENTHEGMLSTSQVMKLSQALAGLYPEGFGLDLIDRAESLGKSIFSFVEKAKREDKTILATIVGEKPAQVPEEVGVFVVEKGVVK